MLRQGSFPAGCILGLIVVLAGTGKVIAKPGADGSRENFHALSSLGPKMPSITQAIEPTDRTQDCKFVQVEVVEVKNPKNFPVTFKVEYQSKQEKVFLGTFSLYPPNNPGRFIVPAKAKLGQEGAVVLTLIIPAEAQNDGNWKVVVNRLKFLTK